MKRFIPVILLLLPVVLFFSCKNDEEPDPAEKLNDKMPWEDYSEFTRYTDYLTVPDFLTEVQADLYKKAAILHYIFISHPRALETIPRLNEQTEAEITEIQLDGRVYYKSAGRYSDYADFLELCLSVFTREFFEELNKHAQFIEIDGSLFISGETESEQMSESYAPWNKPDEFEPVSIGENEIIFNMTGYYFEEPHKTAESGTENAAHLTVEIVLNLTDSGWRFSRFATAGNPYVFYF
ncbi:MAG: hypothetical protein FWH24_02695 [Oscillospiraceae bacterium]|nr:hypothetical protein [Oscillospiraceae bacterium]